MVTLAAFNCQLAKEKNVKKKKSEAKNLSPLENACMQVIWKLGAASAEQVRMELSSEHDLKDSTIRTLLRRLEAKDVLTHRVDGRTYVYEPKRDIRNVAGDAVQQIADRFFRGSLSSLLLGMADDSRISADELRLLADKVEQAQSDDHVSPQPDENE